MNNYVLLSNGGFVSVDELYHHGVKGQKWGVRRYQNKDGTLIKTNKKQTSKSDTSAPTNVGRSLRKNGKEKVETKLNVPVKTLVANTAAISAGVLRVASVLVPGAGVLASAAYIPALVSTVAEISDLKKKTSEVDENKMNI